MKIRIAFLSTMAFITGLTSFAQVVEFDDMYFNAKDRTKLIASKPVSTYVSPATNEVVTPINPTDSYSARNVNPEYLAQSKLGNANSPESVQYFSPDYTPTGVNQNIYNNPYNSNSFFNNPYNYGMSGFGNPYGSFNPYFSAFSPYGSMYPLGMNSMYSSGWNTMWSVGFGFGSGMWGNPFYSNAWGCGTCWNSFYGGGFGWNPWGWNSYYPGSVIIINDPANTRPVAYGKRNSRSNDLNNTVYNNNRATSNTTAVLDSNGKARGAGGRTAASNEPGSYYQRGWRENPETRPSAPATWSNSSNRSGTQNSWYNNSSRSGNNSSSGSFFNSGSRSSGMSSGGSSFSGGGGSRSSGSGGGSSGVRRGRD